MNSTKVLIADDDPLVRNGLVSLVDMEDDFRVIGQACDGSEAVEKTRRLNPDVILMDIQMPFCSGLEATRKIKSEFPNKRIIILTVHTNELNEAILAGASNFLVKDSPPEILFSAMRDNDAGNGFGKVNH
jgi:DNA-binding NarL/FixJ family response regulator